MLGKPGLLEHRIGGVPGFDLLIDREGQPGVWREPDVVVTLAVTPELTSSRAQEP